MRTIAVFWPDLEALGALPVPAALELALELTGRWESPPPLDRRHVGRRRAPLQLYPTREAPDGGLKALLTLWRPRDRTSTAETTWKGAGEHGKGKGEDLHPEAADDGADELDEALHQLDETVEDVAVDQELEDREQPDPLPRQHP